MRRLIVVLGLVLGLQMLPGCSWVKPMQDLDKVVNDTTMTGFLGVRAHPAGTPYAGFDWTTDGCSSGPLGDSPYKFTEACWRHDFSYRNLKRIEAETRADMWNERNKYVADRRFQDDMKRRCETYNVVVKPTCNVAAETFYRAVRLVPPYASDQTEADNPRHFRW